MKSSVEEKTKLFFSLYDLENHGYITQDEFMTMLLNYPMEHISNITDDPMKDPEGYRSLRGESFRAYNDSVNRESMDNLDGSEAHRPPSKLRKYSLNEFVVEAMKEDKLSSGRNREAKKSLENPKQLNTSDQALDGQFDLGFKLRKRTKSSSMIPEHYEMMSTVLKRKGSADSIKNYNFQCTTINNKIKLYVTNLFLELDCCETGQMTYDKFKVWISQHPMVLTHFEENFQTKIWKSVDPKEDRLNFKTLKPELNFWANFYTNKRKKERLWIELHNKFLICLISKDDNVPRRVVLLDGLALTVPESSGGVYSFVLSAKSPYYKIVHLEIEDKLAFDKLVEKLSYLRE